MPSRRGRNKQQPEHPDPIVRFATALKQTEEREKAERQRIKAEREEAARQARLAAEHAEAVRVATLELDSAIAAARAARSAGRGVPEADLAWSRAKARMIELETGERPDWGID
jgi:multidrug efflux pump subunit AcrA (membrane-fusion protein)